MDLTFAQDYSTTVQLDSGLLGLPDSGLYWNLGVHPSITVNNVLELLPHEQFTFSDYDPGTTYGKYESTKNINDVVLYDSKLYYSLISSNIGNTPSGSSINWQETNEESLRLRAFIWRVEDTVLNALNFQRKLVESQQIYHVADNLFTPNTDFIGWAFDNKGTDYVKIRINKIACQANTTNPVSMYVIKQGRLVETLTLNPDNALFEFETINYTITGKGVTYFVIDSQEVKADAAYNDALKYSSFVCYPISGNGDTAYEAEYSRSSSGNGLGWDISVYYDSSDYVESNLIDFAKFRQSQFAMTFMEMLYNNSNAQSNRTENILRSVPDLQVQVLDFNANTVARKYKYAKKEAIEAINRTFDKFLKNKSKKLRVRSSSI